MEIVASESFSTYANSGWAEGTQLGIGVDVLVGLVAICPQPVAIMTGRSSKTIRGKAVRMVPPNVSLSAQEFISKG
jgi:hypothetical protein